MYSESWILCSLPFQFPKFYASFHDSHQIFHKNNVTFPQNDALFLDYTFKSSINWLIVVFFKYFHLEIQETKLILQL